MRQPLRQIRHRGQQHAQQRRDKHEAAHAIRGESPEQTRRVFNDKIRNNDRGNAAQQRTKKLPDRVYKRQHSLLAADLAGVEGESIPHPLEPVNRRPVRYLDPLGNTGRSRCVNEVHQLLRRSRQTRIRNRGRRNRFDAHRRHCLPSDTGEQGTLRKQQPGTGVPEHERQAFGGIAGIERKISAAGLEYAQERRHRFGISLQTDGDGNVRLRAECE